MHTRLRRNVAYPIPEVWANPPPEVLDGDDALLPERGDMPGVYPWQTRDRPARVKQPPPPQPYVHRVGHRELSPWRPGASRGGGSGGQGGSCGGVTGGVGGTPG